MFRTLLFVTNEYDFGDAISRRRFIRMPKKGGSIVYGRADLRRGSAARRWSARAVGDAPGKQDQGGRCS